VIPGSPVSSRRAGLAWLAAALAASVLLLPGCGEDEGDVFVGERIDLRNGTWNRVRTVTYTGADTCEALAEMSDTTLVLCSIDPVAGTTRRFDCDVEQEGEAVSFDCTSLFDTGPCRILYTLAGGGTVTDTTFTLEGSLVTDVLGDSSVCAEFVFPCTSMVTETGTFVSEAGADSCADLEERVPVENLIRDLTRTLPRPGLTGP